MGKMKKKNENNNNEKMKYLMKKWEKEKIMPWKKVKIMIIWTKLKNSKYFGWKVDKIGKITLLK